MTATLTRHTKEGIVDMVAVAAFAAGRDVTLTPLEKRVAIHVMDAAGISQTKIARRFRTHDSRIREELARPAPVDSTGHTFTLDLD